MATFRKFEDIECWQLGRKLDKELFPLTKQNGFDRDFKLKDQILDATGSVMDNIAEGFGRRGNKEFVRFLGYSKGSTEEIKSQLYRAMDRGYINQNEFQSLYEQSTVVGRKLGSLMNHLEQSEYKSDYSKKSGMGDHDGSEIDRHRTGNGKHRTVDKETHLADNQ